MSQPSIRIASFNLESLDEPPRGRVAVEKRIEILRPQLLRLRADVLCLQEVNGQNETDGTRSLRVLDKVLSGTAYANYHRVHSQSPSGKGARDRHNLVTLSRFPITKFEEVCHTRMEPPLYHPVTEKPLQKNALPINWERPVLMCQLDLGTGTNNPLHVINVHLRAPRAAFISGQKKDATSWKSMPGWAEGYFIAALKQSGQALEVRFLIDEIFDANPRALVCVVGDFNADDHEAPVRIIRGDEDDVGSGEFAARMLVAAERSLPESQRFSIIHRGKAQMFDHILVSNNLLAWLRKTEIHNEALGDEVASPAAIADAPESYHAPIVADFENPL